MLAQPRGLGGERKRAAGTIKCFTAEGIEDRKDFTEGGHFYEQIKPPSACHREVHSSGRKTSVEHFSSTSFQNGNGFFVAIAMIIKVILAPFRHCIQM